MAMSQGEAWNLYQSEVGKLGQRDAWSNYVARTTGVMGAGGTPSSQGSAPTGSGVGAPEARSSYVNTPAPTPTKVTRGASSYGERAAAPKTEVTQQGNDILLSEHRYTSEGMANYQTPIVAKSEGWQGFAQERAIAMQRPEVQNEIIRAAGASQDIKNTLLHAGIIEEKPIETPPGVYLEDPFGIRRQFANNINDLRQPEPISNIQILRNSWSGQRMSELTKEYSNLKTDIETWQNAPSDNWLIDLGKQAIGGGAKAGLGALVLIPGAIWTATSFIEQPKESFDYLKDIAPPAIENVPAGFAGMFTQPIQEKGLAKGLAEDIGQAGLMFAGAKGALSKYSPVKSGKVSVPAAETKAPIWRGIYSDIKSSKPIVGLGQSLKNVFVSQGGSPEALSAMYGAGVPAEEIGINVPKPNIIIGNPKPAQLPSHLTLESEFVPKTGIETTILARPEIMEKTFGYSPTEIEKVQVGTQLMGMTQTQRSAFILDKFIRETKTLSPKGVEAVLKYTKEQKNVIDELYGSFTARPQMKPELARVPGDIDIQLNVGEKGAIKFTQGLYERLAKAGEKVQISKEKPTLIESITPKGTHHALDIHFKGEPSPDILNPEFEGAYGFKFGQKPTKIESIKSMPLSEQGLRKGGSSLTWQPEGTIAPKPHRMKDVLDFYAVQKTLVESKMIKPAKAETLLGRWKELYPEVGWDQPTEVKLPIQISKAANKVAPAVAAALAIGLAPKRVSADELQDAFNVANRYQGKQDVLKVEPPHSPVKVTTNFDERNAGNLARDLANELRSQGIGAEAKGASVFSVPTEYGGQSKKLIDIDYFNRAKVESRGTRRLSKGFGSEITMGSPSNFLSSPSRYPSSGISASIGDISRSLPGSPSSPKGGYLYPPYNPPSPKIKSPPPSPPTFGLPSKSYNIQLPKMPFPKSVKAQLKGISKPKYREYKNPIMPALYGLDKALNPKKSKR